MTMCDKIRPRLTAYLDGELADEHGSVVRGHLRECPACREMARDEAALRDGLRALAPVDPPAALWAGIQARLAAEEVADARKPRWRRHAGRWLRWLRAARFAPTMPQLAAAAVVAVAAIGLLTWRTHRSDDAGHVVVAPPLVHPGHGPAPVPPATQAPAALHGDVTEELLAEPAQTTASYARVIEELMKLAEQDSTGWSAEARAAFNARITGLRDAIARAGQGHPSHLAQSSMIHYLQTALAREDGLLAAGGAQ